MMRSLVAALAATAAFTAAPWLFADGVAVDSDSVIEMQLPAGLVIPDHPGSWSFQGFVTVAPAPDAVSISQTVADAFRSLFGSAAAPAAESSATPPEENASSHLARARARIVSGDAAGARGQLEEALESASYEDLPELRFTLASALALGGDLTEAVRQLALVTPREADPWAADFAILKSALLLDSFAYAEELTWLDQWAPALQSDAQRAPLYHFLRALGDRGERNTAAERGELALVQAPDGTALGATTVFLLNDL